MVKWCLFIQLVQAQRALLDVLASEARRSFWSLLMWYYTCVCCVVTMCAWCNPRLLPQQWLWLTWCGCVLLNAHHTQTLQAAGDVPTATQLLRLERLVWVSSGSTTHWSGWNSWGLLHFRAYWPELFGATVKSAKRFIWSIETKADDSREEDDHKNLIIINLLNHIFISNDTWCTLRTNHYTELAIWLLPKHSILP